MADPEIFEDNWISHRWPEVIGNNYLTRSWYLLIYLSRYLKQETAKCPLRYRVKLPPVTTSLISQR